MRPTLHCIITIHKNKVKLRRLKAKQECQKEDKNVNSEEEAKVPLKRKRQGEKKASSSKKAKTTQARDSKETLPPTLSRSPNKKKASNPLSPIKYKLPKATTS